MPTAEIAAPIIAAVAGAGLSAAAAASMEPDGPPKLAESNKRVLSSFAQRMANEDKEMRNSDDFKLYPGGQPIRFGSPRFNFLPQRRFLLTGGAT